MNYYEILGVGDKSSPDEIKRAYRKLASQHHPDKGGDKAKFQEIQQAYDTLSDPNKRQHYDMQRNGFGGGDENVIFRWHSGGVNHSNIDEIFRNFGFGFGGDPFAQARQQQRRNKDLRIEIPLALVTTLEEQSKTISVQTTNGHRETVEVKIPKGVTNGTQIKYAGLGDNLFNSLPRGDLYVHFKVHPADGFIANGIDLYHRASVNCLLAVAGGDITVTGLDGKTFLLTVPAGTQPGMKFRLSEQGLYELNSTRRGDLYVEIALTVPQNLSAEQLEIARSLINSQ
jgi:DnaJ-class molecular chaperone